MFCSAGVIEDLRLRHHSVVALTRAGRKFMQHTYGDHLEPDHPDDGVIYRVMLSPKDIPEGIRYRDARLREEGL